MALLGHLPGNLSYEPTSCEVTVPIVDRRNTLTPNNDKAVDVSSKLIKTIMPIQQQRVKDAFRVQGIRAVLYHRLTSGKPCTCVAAQSEMSKLDPNGNGGVGFINEMLTGGQFGVEEYDAPTLGHFGSYGNYSPETNFQRKSGSIQDRPPAPTNKLNAWLGIGDNYGDGTHSLNTHVEPTASTSSNGIIDITSPYDNPNSPFDPFAIGISESSCPICFGSGFVGGYSPYKTWRQVIVPSDMSSTSVLDPLTWSLSPGTHTFRITLPKGAISVDSCRVFNGFTPVAYDLIVANQPIGNPHQLLLYCDGKPHDVVITTADKLTHVELQFALDTESVYFEIPKLTKNHDISLLETTEPFQIQMPPDVPELGPLDIITESQLGKTLVVQTVNPWNTRDRALLAWEAMARVIQPQEIYRILPFRKHLSQQQPTRPVPVTRGSGPTSFQY